MKSLVWIISFWSFFLVFNVMFFLGILNENKIVCVETSFSTGPDFKVILGKSKLSNQTTTFGLENVDVNYVWTENFKSTNSSEFGEFSPLYVFEYRLIGKLCENLPCTENEISNPRIEIFEVSVYSIPEILFFILGIVFTAVFHVMWSRRKIRAQKLLRNNQ